MTETQLTDALRSLFLFVPANLAGYRLIWRAFSAALQERSDIRFHVGASPHGVTMKTESPLTHSHQ
jgi:hypothetical protein